MSSPTNCQTSPHAIIHHQSNQSAASDSNERIVPKESNNLENHGQILDDTLLQNSHGITRLVYRFTQALHCFRQWIQRSNQQFNRIDSPIQETTPSAKATTAENPSSKNWVIDPSQSTFYYYWSCIVVIVILYNSIILIARSAFFLLQERLLILWLFCDYLCDLCYMIDIFIQTRKGYLEQGLIVRDLKKLRKHYMQSRVCLLDIISLLPTDLFYFIPKLSLLPALRFNRLLRVYRVFEFSDKIETQTNHPNIFRLISLLTIILILIHWNACFYFIISRWIGFSSDAWVYDMKAPTGDTLTTQYLYCFFWSMLVLTNIGEVPPPEADIEILFVTADFLTGVIVFATIVGNVGSIISSMNAVRTNFREKVDQVKQYMTFRRVGKNLEQRVLTWFDYLWLQKQTANEDLILDFLPQKLRGEIGIHIHLAALKRVPIFAEAQPGFLIELITRLKLQIFSPGEYVCKKGDIGKEMYIIKRGRLSVVSDDGAKVFVTLEEGSVFGEISILNIPGSKTGNRRTANIRSVGYSDLFCLTKQDLWEVLAEYPSARETLFERGKAHLRKDNLLDEDTARIAQEDQAAIPDKLNQIEEDITSIETRLTRLLREYRSNMDTLDHRLQSVEQIAEAKHLDIELQKRRKTRFRLVQLGMSEDDV